LADLDRCAAAIFLLAAALMVRFFPEIAPFGRRGGSALWVCKVHWIFTLACAAYNLVRMRNLTAAIPTV
jgi:hypothetical protein